MSEPQTALILLSVALFGSGIGNATSLRPLIAQAEFAKEDVPSVVAMMVAFGQATYGFAPAAFGFILNASVIAGARIGSDTPIFFLAVGAVQSVAILCLLASRLGPKVRRTGR